jgi:hypothetical protein
MRILNKCIIVVLVVMNLFFAIFGFKYLFNQADKSEYSSQIIGIVTNIQEKDGLYKYTFSYDYNDVTYTKEYDYDFNKKTTFLLNQKCVMYINPNNPSEYILPTYTKDISFLEVVIPMTGVFGFGLWAMILIISSFTKKSILEICLE